MSIQDFCQDAITWEPYTGQDQAGGAIYGPPQTLICRVEQKLVYDLTPQGAMLLPGTMIYFPTVQPFTLQDRITLPDGSKPKIRLNKINKGLNVADHTTLTCR